MGNQTTLITLFNDLLNFANNTIMPAIFALAFLYFAYNIARSFLFELDAKSIQKRRDQVIYGIMAIVVILSFWGLVALFTSGLGLNTSTMPTSDIEIKLQQYSP